MPIVVTHTDISRFLACRRLWGWTYLQDWQPRVRLDGPLRLGARVHEAVQAHYEDPTLPAEEVVAYHDRMGRQDVDRLTEWGRPSFELDNLYNDIIIGRNCVVAYLDWLADTGADAPFEIVAAEHESEALLLDGKVLLRGKIDQLFRSVDDGSLIIHDLKTTGSYSGSLREQLERSYQHHCYLVTEAVANPGIHIAGAMYTVIRKVTHLERLYSTPVTRFRVPATTRQAPYKLRQIEQICAEMLRTMEQTDELGTAVLYPTPQQGCRWCDFAQPCELADENPLAARAMLDTEFTRGKRHGRYTPVSAV